MRVHRVYQVYKCFSLCFYISKIRIFKNEQGFTSLMITEEDKIKATILYHLRRKKILGGVHTPFDTVTCGFPSHLGKDVKKICQELIKEGWIITKPASYGLQISLNKDKEKLKEIEIFIKKMLDIASDI